MNTETIKTELKDYIKDNINDYKDDILNSREPVNDLHHQLFNQDYYIIGYYNCEQWLKKHNLNTFRAIEFVQDYERMNFGEFKEYTNAEELVNMIVYIIGEEILFNDKEFSINKIKNQLTTLI
tara:strand:+ start:58 stop:426 length:369 start_codon:yes stop_codon:yes gene_type:complete